jgi:hypothetical protein
VIRTLADDTTGDIWNGVNSKAARRIPKDSWPVVLRKLDQIDAVTKLDDLKVPREDRLHPCLEGPGAPAQGARPSTERVAADAGPFHGEHQCQQLIPSAF